jgi:hypothetical protein
MKRKEIEAKAKAWILDSKWYPFNELEGEDAYLSESHVDFHLSLLSDTWISVEDREPTEFGEYLVQCKNGKTRVCDYGSFENRSDMKPLFRFPYCEQAHHQVIAWQPLPAPFTPPATEGGEK